MYAVLLTHALQNVAINSHAFRSSPGRHSRWFRSVTGESKNTPPRASNMMSYIPIAVVETVHNTQKTVKVRILFLNNDILQNVFYSRIYTHTNTVFAGLDDKL